MTKKELELTNELEKLKKLIKQKDLKIADLETEKKTLKLKLSIQSECFEDWKKENSLSLRDKIKLEKKIKEMARKQKLYVLEKKYEKESFEKEIENLNVIVENLTHRLGKNSDNSSIPPSTQMVFTKKKCVNTSREKTNRSSGGQVGHKGNSLTKEKARELIESGKVDHVIEDHVFSGADKISSECIVKYEIDLEIKTKVIEHRFYGRNNKKEIPQKFNTDVHYGNNIKSFVAIAINEGFVSLNRTRKIIRELTNNTIKLSEGSLVNFNRELAINSENSIESIKEELIKSGVLHIDETRIKSKW